MNGQCRSNCRSAIRRRVVALSQSGRAWSSSVCGDETHLMTTLAMLEGLGFTVERIERVAA